MCVVVGFNTVAHFIQTVIYWNFLPSIIGKLIELSL
jgi:hypothetical protein